MISVSKVILSMTALAAVSCGVYELKAPALVANAQSNETVVYIDPSLKSGSIDIDSNGKLISCSSPLLNPSVKIRSAENNKYGRWVYYADGLINRKGHSNFYSTQGSHFSWVSMGSKSKKYATANSGKYSYATQSGSGTFHCGYGLSNHQ